MRVLIALRYPVGKNQMKTVEKALSVFPRSSLVVLHIGGSGKGTEERLRKEFGKRAKVICMDKPLVEAINDVAEKERADIVVMGKHRRSLIDVVLDGLVETDAVASIIRKIKKPVLVV